MAGPERPALFGEPHRRWDPLRGDWVLVSPGRADRPWQGREEATAPAALPAYDPACYLCPGNARAGGERNSDYLGTFAFTNDFASLRPTTPAGTWHDPTGLLQAEGAPGTCRVLCYAPRHDAHLGSMDEPAVRAVIDAWAGETRSLGEQWPWVQAFENRGAAMGASSPHPHGQIWATSTAPREALREDATQRAHLERTGLPLLLEVAELESDGPRAVEATEDWLAIVPFWAQWPFEILLLPRRHVARLPELDVTSRDDLARLLGGLVRRCDALFSTPFPYSLGWHGAPFTEEAATDAWQLHAHLYPPLLRSATVRKFRVGYELLAEPQRDLLPEEAAERLRAADGLDTGPA